MRGGTDLAAQCQQKSNFAGKVATADKSGMSPDLLIARSSSSKTSVRHSLVCFAIGHRRYGRAFPANAGRKSPEQSRHNCPFSKRSFQRRIRVFQMKQAAQCPVP